MRDERRSAVRARVPGVRVTYEGASGGRVEGDVLDIGAGGVFVRAERPVAVGKRLALEIRLAGDAPVWPALGRVVWTREANGTDGPAGMGVKLIDTESDVIAAIERLVASRERTDPGTGGAHAPARERTMLGVGVGGETQAPAAPIVAVAPTRERTVLGVGGAGATPPVRPPSREPSGREPPPEDWDLPGALASELPADVVEGPGRGQLAEPVQHARALAPEPSAALDLVRKKPDSPAPLSDTSLAAAGLPRRRGTGWLFVFAIAAAAAGVTYAERARIPWQRMQTLVGWNAVRQPATTAVADPSPPPLPVSTSPAATASATASAAAAAPATAATTAPTATEAPTASASSSPNHATPSASNLASSKGPRHAGIKAATRSAPASAPASAARPSNERANDNPY